MVSEPNVILLTPSLAHSQILLHHAWRVNCLNAPTSVYSSGQCVIPVAVILVAHLQGKEWQDATKM